MNFKKLLKEEFFYFVKSRSNETIEVYVNPTINELIRETKKDYLKNDFKKFSFRTIINLNNHNIYIFPYLLLHEDVYKALQEKDTELKADTTLMGFVTLDEENRKKILTVIIKNPYFYREYKKTKIDLHDKKYNFISDYFTIDRGAY